MIICFLTNLKFLYFLGDILNSYFHVFPYKWEPWIGWYTECVSHGSLVDPVFGWWGEDTFFEILLMEQSQQMLIKSQGSYIFFTNFNLHSLIFIIRPILLHVSTEQKILEILDMWVWGLLRIPELELLNFTLCIFLLSGSPFFEILITFLI